jgi:hypothetical protein
MKRGCIKSLKPKRNSKKYLVCDLRVFFAVCGKKLTTKYVKKAQSNTEFLLSKI